MLRRLGLVFGCAVCVSALVMCGGDDDGAGATADGADASTSTGGDAGGPPGPPSDGGGDSAATKPEATFGFLRLLPGRFQAGFGDEAPVAAAPGGGFVVALPFTGTVTIASDSLTSNGRSIAIVKVDAKGTPVWAKALQPNDETKPRSLAVDDAGNIMFAGTTFSTTMDFGDGKTLASPTGDSDKSWAFVARFDATGATTWARSFTADGGFLDLQVAAESQAVVLSGTAALGKVRYETAGGSQVSPSFMGYESKAFVLSLTPADGLATWFEEVSAPSGALAAALALLPSHEIVLVGTFRGGALESDDPATFAAAPGPDNAFVTKLGPTGAHVWTRAFGGASATAAGSALAVDASGRLVAAGAFTGSVDFGAGARTGSTWVASLDPASGTTTWDKALPTGVPVGLALDEDGAVAVSFDMYDDAAAASVDGVAFPTVAHGFIAGLAPTGAALWVHAATGDVPRFSGTLASGGDVVVEYGTFEGTADFGGGAVTSRDDGGTGTAYLFGFAP